jgi:hypothetical protein
MVFCPYGVLGMVERAVKALNPKRNPPESALRTERAGP